MLSVAGLLARMGISRPEISARAAAVFEATYVPFPEEISAVGKQVAEKLLSPLRAQGAALGQSSETTPMPPATNTRNPSGQAPAQTPQTMTRQQMQAAARERASEILTPTFEHLQSRQPESVVGQDGIHEMR